jgi:hypothetical protein
VGDAGHQPSQRGELLRLDETILRSAQILERLRQLPGALLQCGEQPRVLDGDHRLTGKGFQELDLRLGKQLRLEPHDCDGADRDLVAHHGYDENAAIAGRALQFAVSAGDEDVRLVHDAPLAHRHRDQIAAGDWGRIGLSHRRHRFRGELIVRDKVNMVAIPAIGGAQHALA